MSGIPPELPSETFPGSGGGGTDVTDGTTTVSNAVEIDFTNGAVVTNAGGGIAHVAIIESSNIAVTDGTTTVTNPTSVDFTSGAVVTNVGGSAHVAIATGGHAGEFVQLASLAPEPGASGTEIIWGAGITSFDNSPIYQNSDGSVSTGFSWLDYSNIANPKIAPGTYQLEAYIQTDAPITSANALAISVSGGNPAFVQQVVPVIDNNTYVYMVSGFISVSGPGVDVSVYVTLDAANTTDDLGTVNYSCTFSIVKVS